MQAGLGPGDRGSRRSVPLAASFAETALRNAPGARENIIAPAARPVPSVDPPAASQRFTLGGNGPVRPGDAPGIRQDQGPLGGIQEPTANPGGEFGPAARVANRLNNPGSGGAGGAALNASAPGLGGLAVGGLGPGPDLTGTGILRGGANQGLGGNLPSLTPQPPTGIANETLGNNGQGVAAINAPETPTEIGSLDEDGEANTFPPQAPQLPTEIVNETVGEGQGVAAINDREAAPTAGTLDEDGPGNAVAPQAAPRPSPTQIATDDAPRSGPERAIVPASDAPGGIGDDPNLVIGGENEIELVEAIVPLTPEAPTDVAEEAVPLPGLPEEETPGIATALTRETDESDATRAPAAVVADRELRNVEETPQTIGAAAEETLRIPQGPVDVTGPVETDTILPERLAGPEPAETDSREPEATEEANNPEVAPTAVAEGPAPAPEPERVAVAPPEAPTNPDTLGAESPAPAPGARPDENSPEGQQALVARAVAAFEAQQLAARFDEPVETGALEDLFI